MTETILANATLVLPDGTRRGTLCLRDGQIADIGDGAGVPAGAIDCRGDLVMPGLVELHTDNLERHIEPRPRVDWPHQAAIIAHDAELAGVGITTVFDALRVGSLVSNGKANYGEYARALADEILDLRAQGALRISHFLHLRAEVCSETLVAELAKFGPERPRRHRQPDGPHPRPAPVPRHLEAQGYTTPANTACPKPTGWIMSPRKRRSVPAWAICTNRHRGRGAALWRGPGQP
jgi:hypothetical protein